jgi:hypothetical protein
MLIRWIWSWIYRNLVHYKIWKQAVPHCLWVALIVGKEGRIARYTSQEERGLTLLDLAAPLEHRVTGATYYACTHVNSILVKRSKINQPEVRG